MSRSITSRTFSFLIRSKCLKENVLAKTAKNTFFEHQIRKSGGGVSLYKKPLHEDKKREKYGVILSAIFWWWILWHLFTEYEELYGTPLPDPSKWTDEELGIPPA